MNSMMRKPLLQDLVKEAMEGTVQKVNVTAEALRQFGGYPNDEEQTKTASVEEPSVLNGEFVEKLASALEYISDALEKDAANPNSPDNASPGVGPGQGQNTLQVMKAESSEENIDAGEGGKAVPKEQPPMNPSLQSVPGQSSDPSNALESNDSMMHGEQPVEPISNEKASIKAAQALFEKNLERLGLPKEASRTLQAPPQAKLGGANQELLAKNLARLGFQKQAEDAINPAQISAGPAPAQGAAAPPGVSEAEKGPIPAEPSDVNSQKRLIASNDAAINYSKRDAKADPKKDMGNLLAEPMQSKATDKTLSRVWDHTDQAGAKIAGDMTRTAAARALLAKLASKQETKTAEGESCASGEDKVRSAVAKAVKGKEKDSQGMGGPTPTPEGHSGFRSADVGGM